MCEDNDKLIDCPWCAGHGEQPCPHCGQSTPCDYCEGIGAIEDPDCEDDSNGDEQN